MTKEEIITQLEIIENEMKIIKQRVQELSKENETLKSLVNHLASRPNPYVPPVQVPNYPEPPWKVTC
jgi:hypothetical protein